jgi:hypothetical protein
VIPPGYFNHIIKIFEGSIFCIVGYILAVVVIPSSGYDDMIVFIRDVVGDFVIVFSFAVKFVVDFHIRVHINDILFELTFVIKVFVFFNDRLASRIVIRIKK